MSDTPVEYRLLPPLMGEQTEEVLRELGFILRMAYYQTKK